jgi:hypothetical protein
MMDGSNGTPEWMGRALARSVGGNDEPARTAGAKARLMYRVRR